MNKTDALQNLLNGKATEEDIALLKRLLASGEISIGGNVNQSILITGSGNSVTLTVEALDRLNARPMLGNLDRDLTGEEIASGLRRLDKLLPNRAPVLLPHYKEQVGRLRPILKTEVKTLSETSRRERLEALAAINSNCVEAVDVSFNGLALGEAAPDYDARSPFRGLESFCPEDYEKGDDVLEWVVGLQDVTLSFDDNRIVPSSEDISPANMQLTPGTAIDNIGFRCARDVP